MAFIEMSNPVPGSPPELCIDGRIATIVLRRPEVANRLELTDLDLLRAYIDKVNAEPDVLVLRLTAQGRHFCSGFNIGSLDDTSSGARLEALTNSVEQARPVTIAALNGGAYGGATDLALACDFRLGVPQCDMSVPAARLGLLFYRGGMERYVSRLGLPMAKRILLTAEKLDAQQMLACGYLDRLAASVEALPFELDALSASLAGMAPLALLGMKKYLNAIARGDADDEAMANDIARADASDDLREGMLAWQEKRPPRFRGR